MRKEIKTDRFLEGIQIRQRIIKEATGVDFTAVSTGFTRISTVRDKNASTARRIPSIKAMENPSTILPKLNPAECQKSPVKISSKNLRITETGDASKISCPSHILAICQTAIQKSTASMRIPVYFLFSVLSLSFVIEPIVRQLSSNNLRILII